MSNEQHTPGPWRVGSDGSRIMIRADGPQGAIDVAYVCRTSKRSRQNAAILASSPTLAAENKRLREAAETIFEDYAPTDWESHSAFQVWRDLRAALAGGDA